MSAPGSGDPPAVDCSHCGTRTSTVPVPWVYEVDPRRGGHWICDRCARANLRSIEAKLEQEWW